jgi:hypothetical protein
MAHLLGDMLAIMRAGGAIDADPRATLGHGVAYVHPIRGATRARRTAVSRHRAMVRVLGDTIDPVSSGMLSTRTSTYTRYRSVDLSLKCLDDVGQDGMVTSRIPWLGTAPTHEATTAREARTS